MQTIRTTTTIGPIENKKIQLLQELLIEEFTFISRAEVDGETWITLKHNELNACMTYCPRNGEALLEIENRDPLYTDALLELIDTLKTLSNTRALKNLHVAPPVRSFVKTGPR